MQLLQLEYTCIKVISNEIYLMCDALGDAHFTIFSFYAHFAIFSFLIFFKNFDFSLKLFLICSYFLGDLCPTALIKCVLNLKKV